ncbi:MAG TPA: N-methyl-L-tryptophan oxidase [Gemmataceae bacterium]|jgi:sarcosine oxidase|nr:N-methyl-L-tryptophan oxidase [Gemmataceae bacterium]
MPQPEFDVIVIGAGGMGSAATYELARRGLSVLALEQFSLVHDRGSSHGHTRIIRRAYYEHPGYVPLVRRAFERWYDLEQRTGRHLLTECGCLGVGPADGEVVAGVLASAREHGLAVEQYDAAGLHDRFPQFRFGDGYAAVLERDAGFLYVEDCVRAHLDAAWALGAAIHAEEPVTGWGADGTGVTVTTTKGTYHAARLVLTAGPWSSELLAARGAALRVMRQTMLWFGPTDPGRFRRDVFPIFLAEVPDGPFYGLPAVDGRGVKVARHYGAAEQTSPADLDREPRPADGDTVRRFLTTHLPAAAGPLTDARTCIYTLTPDRHFLIDRHPDLEQVAVAAGFSGHGFKFAPVVGEILADLAESGTTKWDIGMFRFERFGAPGSN